MPSSKRGTTVWSRYARIGRACRFSFSCAASKAASASAVCVRGGAMGEVRVAEEGGGKGKATGSETHLSNVGRGALVHDNLGLLACAALWLRDKSWVC